MEIILAITCAELTGTLNKKHGYAIVLRKGRFYGQRNSKGNVPPDGHWRFIADCADLAASGMIIANIKVPALELYNALHEAHHAIAAQQVQANAKKKTKNTYNARDIRNLKRTFSL